MILKDDNSTYFRAEALTNVLALIKNENIRNFCIELIGEADDYFFIEPASSSGKYHPEYAHGEGGLLRHSMAVARLLNYILECNMFTTINEKQKDLLICGALVHDIKKYGKKNCGHTVKTHPDIASEFIMQSNYEKFSLTKDDAQFIADAVISHMGQWGNILPQTDAQKLLHIADCLASKKDIALDFSNEPKIETSQMFKEAYTGGDYVIPFGQWKGTKLKSIEKSYITWLVNEFAGKTHPAVINAKKYLNEIKANGN